MTERSLILVHTPGWQDIRDFDRIKDIVATMAPDIEVFIASNMSPNSYTRKVAARKPTLIFSPVQLQIFKPLRGRLYTGQQMNKLTEMQILRDAGLPVPYFEELTPHTRLTKEKFGRFTVLKPSHPLASWGMGIELLRTEDVVFRRPDEFAPRHLGRHGPMIAQAFVDSGKAMTCRVLTFFGEPIFTYCRVSTKDMQLEDKIGPIEMNDFMPAPPHSIGFVSRDPDFLSVAALAYQAMPNIALQACDLMRDKDGRVFILEVNPGGGAWMFSSVNAQAYKERLGVADLQDEFDAFRTCARLLVERTRREAV